MAADVAMGAADAWGRLRSLTPGLADVTLVGEVTFGRSTASTVVLTNTIISGKHCKVYNAGGSTPMVVDTSTNGVFVNGAKVGKGKTSLLRGGDVITLAKPKPPNPGIEYVFEMGAAETNALFESYDLCHVLGRGNFAAVHLCIHKETGEQFAVKCIDKRQFALQQPRQGALMDEVNILKEVNHPNIIGIHDMFETESTLYLVLELVTGGELFDKIVKTGRLEESEARDLFRQMLEGVHYLHTKGIVHRDLKPENILLKSPEDSVIKISDFGLSRVISEGSFMKTLCGTPQYIAPEVLERNPNGYTPAVDMWSLGVILFALLSGTAPFDDRKGAAEMYNCIKTGRYHFPDSHWANVSGEAKRLICKLLTVDPSLRFTAFDALRDPWVVGEVGGTLAMSLDAGFTETPTFGESPADAGPAAPGGDVSMAGPTTTTTTSASPGGGGIAAVAAAAANAPDVVVTRPSRRRPTYEEMVVESLTTLQNPRGSPLTDIESYIRSNFEVSDSFSKQLPRMLNRITNKKGSVIVKSDHGFKLK